MSLLIKGMDVPISCTECPCYDDMETCFCNVLDSYCEQYKTERHPDCPLAEIPTPLGRLIDADAHIQSLKENQCGERCRKNHDCVNCGIGMYIRIVENEPTILEAEE